MLVVRLAYRKITFGTIAACTYTFFGTIEVFNELPFAFPKERRYEINLVGMINISRDHQRITAIAQQAQDFSLNPYRSPYTIMRTRARKPCSR